MCGFLYVKFKGKSEISGELKAITEAAAAELSYRGPDYRGLKIFKNNVFIHYRLSIIDVTSNSNQPFESDENIFLYNGEIFNYKDFDKNSNSDTKVFFDILENNCENLKLVQGFYAAGIFSKSKNEINFYRDYFGEKPLFYFNDASVAIVSSTIKSIAKLLKDLGKTCTINEEGILKDYLPFGYIREPRTIFSQIFACPPNHILKISENEIEQKEIGEINSNIKIEQYANNAMESADVKGTLLLSSGIDSTFLLSLLSCSLKDFNVATYKADDFKVDESTTAYQNYKKITFGTSNSTFKYVDCDRDLLLDVYEYSKLMEQPTSDGIQFFKLLKALKRSDKNLRLIFTGLGGDELYGGYPMFYNFKIINILVHIPFIERIIPKMERFVFFKRNLGQWNPIVYAYSYRCDFKFFKSLKFEKNKIITDFNTWLYGIFPNTNFDKYNCLETLRIIEVRDYMLNQLLRDSDNISMQLGIESRNPLLAPFLMYKKIDYKKGIKNNLMFKYKINFGKKRGFTLSRNILKNELIKFMTDNKFSEKNRLLDLIDLNKCSYAQVFKIVNLLLWLKSNSIYYNDHHK